MRFLVWKLEIHQALGFRKWSYFKTFLTEKTSSTIVDEQLKPEVTLLPNKINGSWDELTIITSGPGPKSLPHKAIGKKHKSRCKQKLSRLSWRFQLLLRYGKRLQSNLTNGSKTLNASKACTTEPSVLPQHAIEIGRKHLYLPTEANRIYFDFTLEGLT